jgi:hypothetical protein
MIFFSASLSSRRGAFAAAGGASASLSPAGALPAADAPGVAGELAAPDAPPFPAVLPLPNRPLNGLPLPDVLLLADGPLLAGPPLSGVLPLPDAPLLPGALPAPGRFAGSPPAQADSATPAANTVTTLNLRACKGSHSWLEIADAGDGKVRTGRDWNEPSGLAVLRIRMKPGGRSRQSLR